MRTRKRHRGGKDFIPTHLLIEEEKTESRMTQARIHERKISFIVAHTQIVKDACVKDSLPQQQSVLCARKHNVSYGRDDNGLSFLSSLSSCSMFYVLCSVLSVAISLSVIRKRGHIMSKMTRRKSVDASIVGRIVGSRKSSAIFSNVFGVNN